MFPRFDLAEAPVCLLAEAFEPHRRSGGRLFQDYVELAA
jgi:hypothetical protein